MTRALKQVNLEDSGLLVLSFSSFENVITPLFNAAKITHGRMDNHLFYDFCVKLLRFYNGDTYAL